MHKIMHTSILLRSCLTMFSYPTFIVRSLSFLLSTSFFPSTFACSLYISHTHFHSRSHFSSISSLRSSLLIMTPYFNIFGAKHFEPRPAGFGHRPDTTVPRMSAPLELHRHRKPNVLIVGTGIGGITLGVLLHKANILFTIR